MTRLAVREQQVVAKRASYIGTKAFSYRILVRFNPVRGFGGSAFTDSIMLEYDPWVEVTGDDLFRLLVREMVHDWAVMQSSGIRRLADESTWYLPLYLEIS